MKKFKILSIIALIVVAGCQKQVFNKTPQAFFSEDDVWNDMSLIKKFENSIYQGLRTWHTPNNRYTPYALYCSDAMNAEDLGNDYEINVGGIAPDLTGGLDTWSINYNYIRMANIFLSRIGKVDVGTDQEKKVLEGEVKFIRARLYFDLIRNYGGVPLITNVFSLDDDFNVSRSSFEDCVDWIVKELDDAMDLLPLSRPDDEWGRVTKPVCLGLKAEVLLQANSKLHDPNEKPNGPLFSYTKNTWKECADAAKAVIDMPQFELQVVHSSQEYHDMLIRPNPSVIIFPQIFSSEFGTGTPINTLNGLPQFGGWMEVGPLQGLVDEFEMKNGKRIHEPGSGYDPSPGTIYDNRDLRFYADISFNGSTWQNETFDVVYPDGFNVNTQFSTTGYLQRKFKDESLPVNIETPVWPRLRLATLYLIYAEAEYELGNDAVARMYVNKVRERVQMPDINSSGEDLFKDIQHERRIELCFENYRYFDVRRWKIASVVENEPAMGIIWKKKDVNGGTEPSNLEYSIEVFQQRKFPEKFYYLPIPQNEMDRSSSLTQNPGYN